MSDSTKRYLISSLDTFLAVFVPAFLWQVSTSLDALANTGEPFQITAATAWSIAVAGFVAGSRAMIKYARERLSDYQPK